MEALIKDQKTKEAFIDYLHKHKDERFFQAFCNFAKEYFGDEFNYIYHSKEFYDQFKDIFFLECDKIH